MMTPDEKARELAFLKLFYDVWNLDQLQHHIDTLAGNVTYWRGRGLIGDMDICYDMETYNEHKQTLAEQYKKLLDELAQQKAALRAFGTLEEYKNNVITAKNKIAELEKEIEAL